MRFSRLAFAGPPLLGLLLPIGAYKAGRHHLKEEQEEEEIEPNPKGRAPPPHTPSITSATALHCTPSQPEPEEDRAAAPSALPFRCGAPSLPRARTDGRTIPRSEVRSLTRLPLSSPVDSVGSDREWFLSFLIWVRRASVGGF